MTRSQSGTLILVTRNGMGHGDPDLQRRLISKWLELVRQDGRLPGAIALYSEGVHLATEDSPVVEALRDLQERGVHVILCKTCIDHYGIADAIAVGVVGGMGDILAAQWSAKKVIAL